MAAEGLNLTFIRADRRGNGVLKVELNGQTLHVAEYRITDPAERERAMGDIGKLGEGIDGEAIRRELLKLAGDAAGEHGDGDDHKAHESQATLLVKLADDADLFHTPGTDGEGYATVRVGDHRETWRVNSKGFRRWLCGRFWKEYGKAPGAQALQDALGVIASKALFDAKAEPVAVRQAQTAKGMCLDLGDDAWRAVEVTGEGWRVTDNPPVRFIRPAGLLPLPVPVAGGKVDELRPLVNIGSDAYWALVMAWATAALRGRGPFPILAVNGEQGSAKSTACRMLQRLIDPNGGDLRAEPKEVRDLMIAANNVWLLAFDNFSHIPTWLSDALCRLATGGGFASRELYSDGDEKLFHAMRPVLLNGIEELATRSDLLDRCVNITLPSIPETRRRPEAELWRDFDAVCPRVLGALLDAVSAAIRNESKVRLDCLPRMADFARVSVAAEAALGLSPGSFLAAYNGNREGANELAIDAAAIGPAVLVLMADRCQWEGTYKDLLAELAADRRSDQATRNRNDWPKTPKALAGALTRLAPNLRRAEIEVIRPEARTSKGRVVILERVGKAPSLSSQPTPSAVCDAAMAVPGVLDVNIAGADPLPQTADVQPDTGDGEHRERSDGQTPAYSGGRERGEL